MSGTNDSITINLDEKLDDDESLDLEVGALPKLNNQNTVLMRASSKPDNNEPYLMLMHNARIFYFEIDPSKLQSHLLDRTADEMTNIINGMYNKYTYL